MTCYSSSQQKLTKTVATFLRGLWAKNVPKLQDHHCCSTNIERMTPNRSDNPSSGELQLYVEVLGVYIASASS